MGAEQRSHTPQLNDSQGELIKGIHMSKLWGHPNIAREEFNNPNKMDAELVYALQDTRDWISRPMTFTKSSSGVVYHPHGDAVELWSTSHAKGSLHKFDCNHDASAESNTTVRLIGTRGLAQDWDCGVETPEELFDVYLKLERMNAWSGIGLYPHWHRPGFHTDLRAKTHPNTRARWFRIQDGTYYPLTWANWKAQVMS